MDPVPEYALIFISFCDSTLDTQHFSRCRLLPHITEITQTWGPTVVAASRLVNRYWGKLMMDPKVFISFPFRNSEIGAHMLPIR